MKTKLLIFLATLSAGSNYYSLVMPQPVGKEGLNCAINNCNISTQLIFTHLISCKKEFFGTMQWHKDVIDENYQGTISTNCSTSHQNEQNKVLISFETFRDKGDDVTIKTRFKFLNCKLESFQGSSPLTYLPYVPLWIDGMTQCMNSMPGEINCSTKIPFKQFVFEFNRIKWSSPGLWL